MYRYREIVGSFVVFRIHFNHPVSCWFLWTSQDSNHLVACQWVTRRLEHPQVIIYIYIYYMYVYIYIYIICIYIYVYIYFICIYIYMHVCVCVYVHVWLNLWCASYIYLLVAGNGVQLACWIRRSLVQCQLPRRQPQKSRSRFEIVA